MISKHIVFITGAFVSHQGWEPWKAYYTSQGFTCFNPPWPNKNGTVAELRARHPDPANAANRMTAVVNAHAEFVSSLPEKPVIIGHSFGGLITQILVNRGLAAAGVALHSVPPQGVFPYEFSFLKAATPALGLFTSANDTYLMSFKTWQYAFTNGMTLEEQKKAYEENVIPESKRLARDGLTSAAHVDFAKPHAPLLFIAGSTDTITPAHLNKRNFKAYKKEAGPVEYKEFPGKNHFVVSLPSWREEADYILEWVRRQ